MRVRLKELRAYIRNALAPQQSDRQQLGSLGKMGWDEGVLSQDEDDVVNTNLTIDQGPRDIGLTVSDPYVKQDRPAPTPKVTQARM